MITSYKFTGQNNEDWEFQQVFLKKFNLIVGASGSGKTRFLNTLFNFAETVSKGKPFRRGLWELNLKVSEKEYFWKYHGALSGSEDYAIHYEKLIQIDSSGEETVLIERSKEHFTFLDQNLPKLQLDTPSVTLLKDEEIIKPIYNTFAHMQRRKFHDAGLQDSLLLSPISPVVIQSLEKKKDLNRLWAEDTPIHTKMYLFQKYFPDLYNLSLKYFKEVFPTIMEAKIDFVIPILGKQTDIVTPIIKFKEKGVREWLPLTELSSGMQKVLLIITDVLSLPGDTIYILDEYENSLGINAIDFLPKLLSDHGGENQFLISTHHPYLINSMPINSWLVFNRKGSTVRIKSGSEFEEKFGKSKQKLFVQLINDPFYSEIAE